MAEGWKLNEGTVVYEVVTEDQLWTVIVKALSSSSKKTTSYKFALLRAILENLYKTNEHFEMSFNQLGTSFAKLYWNLVVRNGYLQGPNSQVEKEINEVHKEYLIPVGIPFDSLNDSHKHILIKNIEEKVVKRYVVGALFEDTGRLIYSFSKKERKITLTQASWEFLVKHQTAIFKLVNYELAKFLQSKNPDLLDGVVLTEIENITRRESLQQYRELILSHSENKCFYTERAIPKSSRSLAVDHFIPWSFIHSDELWNFVLTSSSLNSSKGNKIPSERYLVKLEQRNKSFIDIGNVHVKSHMENYNFNKVELLYKYAGINGFEIGWTP